MRQSDFPENAPLSLVAGALKVPSQQPFPSLRFNCTLTGVSSWSGGRWRFAPLPLTLIFAFPASPGLRMIFVSPSPVAALAASLNPPCDAFQQGFVPHTPPAGAVARSFRPPWSYKHMV